MQKEQGVAKFTVTRLAALPAGRYKDPAQEGLYLLVRNRQSGDPSRTWVHRLKYQGDDTYIQVGHFPETPLAQARIVVQAQREQLSQGIDPRKAAPRRRQPKATVSTRTALPADKFSIEFLAVEFMELHVKKTYKQPDYVQRILDLDVLPQWRGRDARTIKPREVIELLDGIVARGSNIMANRTAGILGQMFKFGVHRDVIEASPVQLLYRPGGKEAAKDRCLTDEELKALLANPKDATRFEKLSHVIVILLLTGQRRGELTAARWVAVDLAARTWTIPDEDSKNGKGHVVPLSDWAVREFEALQRLARHSKYVLPNEAGDAPMDPKLLTRGVARCLPRMKKLGIAAFTLHDLRRTCRTGLAKLKIQTHIAERVLNHKQEGIIDTYDTHDYVDEKREALLRWAAHLETLVK